MITWLHNFEPSPVLLDLGFAQIHWYGFLMTLAVIIGFIIASFLFRQNDIDKEHIIDLGFYLVIFSLLGARLAHVAVELPYYITNPGQVLAIWNGGLAIHGAILAGIVVVWFYVRKHKGLCETNLKPINPQEGYKIQDTRTQTETGDNLEPKKSLSLVTCCLILTDLLIIPLLLGQIIGRWGNYFNQELYGRPTDLPWGIPISLINRVPGYESFSHFHPTFLYESLANVVLLIILVLLYKKYYSHPELVSGSTSQIPDQVRNDRNILKQPGLIFSLYLLGYSVIRLLTELLRIDRMPMVGGIRLAIIVSGLIIIVALYLMWYIKKGKTGIKL